MNPNLKKIPPRTKEAAGYRIPIGKFSSFSTPQHQHPSPHNELFRSS